MSLQFVTDQYTNLSITTAKINDLAVTTGKLNDLAVTTAKLGANAVTPAKADLTQVWAFTALPTVNLDPVSANDLTRKSYVDSISAGLDPKASVRVATAAVLPNTPTYANGSSGVGATLTASTLTSINTTGIDGLTDLAVGQRVLVKNQATAFQNGIYTVTVVGVDASTAWVLTRATDHDLGGASSPEVSGGNFTFVEEGTVNYDSGWVVITDGTITMGTTSITWTQFTGGGSLTAGNGIDVTGSTVSVKLTATPGLEFSSGSLQVKRDDTGGAGLATVVDRNSNGLAVRVDATTIEGSANSSSGVLRVKDSSISLAKSAWRPKFESFAGDDSSTKFTLANVVNASFYDGVNVYRQGQRLKTVTGAPADLSEYRIILESSVTKVELGAALPSGQVLFAEYAY